MSSVMASDVGEALAVALAGRLDELGVTGPNMLSERELVQRLQELERLARRVEHAIVDVVGEADRRGVWAADGHRSVRGWCQATVNWSGADTTHRIRSVTLLNEFGQVSDALAAGSIGVSQVRELARARANPRCGDELADCVDVMLDNARGLPFDEFRLLVQRWEALADADGAHRSHEQTHAARKVSIEPVGNGFTINGECGVAQGATLREILDRFADAEFHADWEEARARVGDNVTPSDLVRTAAQRRLDALHASSSPPPAPRPAPRRPNRWSTSSSTKTPSRLRWRRWSPTRRSTT